MNIEELKSRWEAMTSHTKDACIARQIGMDILEYSCHPNFPALVMLDGSETFCPEFSSTEDVWMAERFVEKMTEGRCVPNWGASLDERAFAVWSTLLNLETV